MHRCEGKDVSGDLNIAEASRSSWPHTHFPHPVGFTRWGVTGNYLLLSNLRGSARRGSPVILTELQKKHMYKHPQPPPHTHSHTHAGARVQTWIHSKAAAAAGEGAAFHCTSDSVIYHVTERSHTAADTCLYLPRVCVHVCVFLCVCVRVVGV